MRSPETRKLIGLTSMAARLGMSLTDYTAHLDAGELWCSGCKAFHPADKFGKDRRRLNGKRCNCREAVRKIRAAYADTHEEHLKTYYKERWERIQNSRPRDRTVASINAIGEFDIAYLAGLIDGEGCLSISHNLKTDKYQPLLTITMTHQGVLDWFAALAGVPRKTVCRLKNPRHATQYRVQLTGKRAIRLAERCQSWLKVKQCHVQVFLRFRETFIKQGGGGFHVPEETLAQREALRLELKRLNARGPKSDSPEAQS